MSGPVSRLPLTATQPGMVLAEDLRDAGGQVLCVAGTPLDAAIIETLIGHGLTGVAIAGPAPDADAADGDAVRQRLAHLFRRVREEDAWFRALIEDYRLGSRP